MITKEEVKTLADLARIEISDTEALSFTSQIDSILDYVGQIQNVSGDAERVVPKLRNVMRDDVVTNEPKEYTEKILSEAPSREGDFLKVKKILG